MRQRIRVAPVVVDNASAPGVTDEIRRLVPGVNLLELGSNTGFGPAANAGFAYWLGQPDPPSYLMVIPHDVLLVDDCLEQMVGVLQDNGAIGLASADVGDGETPVVDPYFGGITVPAAVKRGWEAADHPHGTMFLARRDCLFDIGLFDERYFAYCEEADLGLRAKAAGWEVGIVRGARVINTTMRSGMAAVDYLKQRNTLLLVREHSGRYHAFIRFCIATGELATGGRRDIPSGWSFSRPARIRAMGDFLRGRYGPPPERFFEQLDQRGDPVSPDRSRQDRPAARGRGAEP